MCEALATNAEDVELLCAVGSSLANFCLNAGNAAAFVGFNGLGALIAALIMNPGSLKLLRVLVKLMDVLIETVEYKEKLGELDACRALLLCVARNCSPDLVGCTGDGYGSAPEAKKGLADYHAEHGITGEGGGWTEATTDDGSVYYVNDTTGETSWEKPAAGAGANAVAQKKTDSTAVDAKGAEIAALWVEAKTDDGRTYYVNTLTDETSWERPSAMDENAAESLRGDLSNHESLMKAQLSVLANMMYENDSNNAYLLTCSLTFTYLLTYLLTTSTYLLVLPSFLLT